MCHHNLHIYKCGDSFLIPMPGPCNIHKTTGKCDEFNVRDQFRYDMDCPYCRRSEKRRKLPGRARGIYAVSWREFINWICDLGPNLRYVVYNSWSEKDIVFPMHILWRAILWAVELGDKSCLSYVWRCIHGCMEFSIRSEMYFCNFCLIVFNLQSKHDTINWRCS